MKNVKLHEGVDETRNVNLNKGSKTSAQKNCPPSETLKQIRFTPFHTSMLMNKYNLGKVVPDGVCDLIS